MKWILVHRLMSFLWFMVLLCSELRTREELVAMDMDMWISWRWIGVCGRKNHWPGIIWFSM
jgi:hypothetical protein